LKVTEIKNQVKDVEIDKFEERLFMMNRCELWNLNCCIALK